MSLAAYTGRAPIESLLAFLLLLAAPPGVATGQPSPDSLEARVDALMAPYDSAGSPGGVVGVIREGEVTFAKGYGMADLAHGVRNTPETRFNLGSGSKQFLGFAFALLADRGDLSLEDPVGKHLEEWPTFADTVRIRHLLSHTSGYREAYGALALAGREAGAHYLPRAEALEVVRRQPQLEFPAGSEFRYNSTAFVVLAEIADAVTEDPISAWMQAEVFDPLGMEHTVIETEVGQVIPGAADSYSDGEDGAVLREVSNRAIFGAAEVFTNVADLARWLGNFESAAVGGRAVQERLREPFVLSSGDTTGYALGIRVDEHRGLRRLEHGGAHAGYRAQISYYPALQAGVVVLSNYEEVDTRAIADSVAGVAFGEHMGPPPEDPLAWTEEAEPVRLDSALLAGYAGTYRSEDDDVVTFEMRGGTLVANKRFRLVPVADTVFRVKGVDAVVAFRSGEAGTVPAAVIRQFGERTDFSRVELWRPTSSELQEFTGRYESPELEAVYRVTVEDSQLVAVHRWRGRMPLRPLTEDTFRTADGIRLEFVRNPAGVVTGFAASIGRTRDVWFQKGW